MTLIPAYGRDYKTAKDVKSDFVSDKDFMIADMSSPYDGRYVNRPQLVGNTRSVTIRYARLTKAVVIKVS